MEVIMKFKVGDIIIGNEYNFYSETAKGIKCKVLKNIDFGNNDILVEIIGSNDKYYVDSYRFNLNKPTATHITINEDGSYEQI